MNKWLKLFLIGFSGLFFLLVVTVFITGITFLKGLRTERHEIKNTKQVHKLLIAEQEKLKLASQPVPTFPSSPESEEPQAVKQGKDELLQQKIRLWEAEVKELSEAQKNSLSRALDRKEFAHTLLQSHPMPDICAVVCNERKLPAHADAEMLAEYFKIMGKDAFNDPAFVREFVLLKILENTIPWRYMELLTLRRESYISDISTVSKLIWFLKDIDWKAQRNIYDSQMQAYKQYIELQNTCKTKSLLPEILKLNCIEIKKKMQIK